MPDTPTPPGQICYAAYVRVRHRMGADDAAHTYAHSVPEERAAWEAAAQAAIAAWWRQHEAILCRDDEETR